MKTTINVQIAATMFFTISDLLSPEQIVILTANSVPAELLKCPLASGTHPLYDYNETHKRIMEILMEERDRFLPALSAPGPMLLLAEGEKSALPGGFKETLLLRAFLIVPGPQYNRVSYEMRGVETAKKVTFYEVILPQGIEWATLRDKTYPSLARYLKAKSINPLAPAGIVISLFFNDHFYLIEAAEFMQAYCDIEGLDAAAFQWRVRQWLAG